MPQHLGSKTLPGQQGPSREAKVWALVLVAPDYLEYLCTPSQAIQPDSSLTVPENARTQEQNPASDTWESSGPLRERPPGDLFPAHIQQGALRGVVTGCQRCFSGMCPVSAVS